MRISYWTYSAIAILIFAVIYRINAGGATPPAQDPSALSAQELLDRMHAANRRMVASGKAFGDAVYSFKDHADPAKIKDSHREAVEVIQELREQFRESQPPDSLSGKNLFAAYESYIQWQEKIFRSDYAAIVRQFEDDSVTPLERENFYQTVFLQRATEEETRNEELSRFRRALMVEHDLKP